MKAALGTLAVFGFNQWTLRRTKPVTSFASASSLFIVVGSLFTVAYIITRKSRQPASLDQLFTKKGHYVRSWGTLYDTLHKERVYFVNLSLLFVVTRSAIIGFGQRNGFLQIILLIISQFFIVFGK
jgi:hypothetical protein